MCVCVCVRACVCVFVSLCVHMQAVRASYACASSICVCARIAILVTIFCLHVNARARDVHV